MFRVQLQALIVAVLILVRVHARAVYAHYLVSHQTPTWDHARKAVTLCLSCIGWNHYVRPCRSRYCPGASYGGTYARDQDFFLLLLIC